LVALQRIFSLLPYSWGVSFGGTIGKLVFILIPKERRRTLSHLKAAFGEEKSDQELERVGRSVFEHYGKTLAELALIDKMAKRFNELVTTSGYEHLDKGLRDGKGIIIVTGHIGNWEIMGGYSAMNGYPLTVIAKKIYYDKYNALLVNLRARMKVETIFRDDSVKKMLSVLRKNRILGFLVDQDVDTIEGVFVNFFGRPAYTSTAPIRFAMASGSPVIPAFIVRDGMRHHVTVMPPLEISRTGDKDEDLRVNTQRWVTLQEKVIREYPHMWVWNHRRWKTLPKEDEPLREVVVNREKI
jgi:KDO2-lipid IV(A) lauroyltransferase